MFDIEGVKYVRSELGKSFESLVNQAFGNIEKSKIIVVIQKHDGSFGKGTIYELEYAKRLNKEIFVLGNDKNENIDVINKIKNKFI